METLADLAGLLAGRRVAVVGVGNERRGDDGVGPFVAARLAAEHPGLAVDAGTVPENFLGPILAGSPEIVLFVDAADHGGAPGTWRLAPLRALSARAATTHHASLLLMARLVEAARAHCWLVGVQPARLAHGEPMSEAVRAAGEQLAQALSAALARRAADA